MDWLKDYDDQTLAEGDAERPRESDEIQYSPVTSSSNHNDVDNNNINIDLMNVCYDTNALASDREGIGWKPIDTPGAEGENSSIAEMHSRSLNLFNAFLKLGELVNCMNLFLCKLLKLNLKKKY